MEVHLDSLELNVLRIALTQLLQSVVDQLVADGRLPSGLPKVTIEDPKDPSHGDFATNFALVASKSAGMPPRQLAEMVASHPLLSQGRGSDQVRGEGWVPSQEANVEDGSHPSPPSPLSPGKGEGESGVLSAVEVAGPGFINLRLNPEYVAGYVGSVLELGVQGFKASASEATLEKKRINVEFVSVNPNGPITIGSGRGAAYGSTLANVLEAAGNTIHREYYINDGVNSEQMRLFAESVRAIILNAPTPERGYRGDFVGYAATSVSIAAQPQLLKNVAAGYKDGSLGYKGNPAPEFEMRMASLHSAMAELATSTDTEGFFHQVGIEGLQRLCEGAMVTAQGLDLAAFGVTFDTWFSEQSLHDAGVVEQEIAALEEKGAADDRPIRHKLKLAKGGVVEDVEIEEQAGDDGGEDAPENPLPSQGRGSDEVGGEGWVPSEGGEAKDGGHPSPPAPLPWDGRGESGGELPSEGGEAEMENHPSPPAPLPWDGRGEPGEGWVPSEVGEAEMENHPSPPAPLPWDGRGEPGTQPTLWLRSTKFGDDMDRVIRRKDGRLTYIASDVAYHKDKFNRPANADKLITVLGPDHHGYIGRLHAVLAAVEVDKSNQSHSSNEPLSEIEAKLYASPEERDACKAALDKARNELDVVIYQLVRFMKEGKPAPMRKRDGNIYALIDLIDEIGKKVKPEESQAEQRKVGKDVARFFYLMRSHDTTFDFDLDLAEKQSDENPVFYVQYAHARICSVIRKAQESGITVFRSFGVEKTNTATPQHHYTDLLAHPKETALIKKILDLPHEVSRAAEDYGVHRLTTYAIELAKAYHHFYDVCRVIQPDQPELSQARLALCEATKIALQATFDLLGIEAPEHM